MKTRRWWIQPLLIAVFSMVLGFLAADGVRCRLEGHLSEPAAGPTGRIAGSEPAREGSTPSPAATPAPCPACDVGLTPAEEQRVSNAGRRRGYQEGVRQGWEYGYRQARADWGQR